MAPSHQATQDRRRALSPAPNPRAGLDYVVTMGGALGTSESAFSAPARLRSIPDDFILPVENLHTYLRGLRSVENDTIEHLAAMIIGDIDAELLPRWIQIQLTAAHDEHQHRVTLEQRKPGWENRLLIARIKID